MSRSLDIVNILRATEIDNTDNNRLLYFGQSAGTTLDSSAVQSVPMQYYETLDSLPMTNLSLGLQAFVEENRKHYVSNGTGWYNTGYEIGAAPVWVTEPSSSYEITDSATPLLITALASDSDNPNLINQSFGSDSAQYMATVSNDSSVFTFTPKTKEQIATAVSAGNLTDSNGDFVYTFKWSDGTNFVTKAVTITYNTVAASIPTYVGDRALVSGGSQQEYAGGSNPVFQNILYYDIPVGSSVLTFGNLSKQNYQFATAGDGSRAVHIGGYYNYTFYDDIDYNTISTTGNATTTSYVTSTTTRLHGAAGNDTYILICGGGLNATERLVTQTLSNSASHGTISGPGIIEGAVGDATRVLIFGGYTNGASLHNTIEYVGYNPAGNAADFGDQSVERAPPALMADATRACAAGGLIIGPSGNVYDTGNGEDTRTDNIDYYTIQTTSNSTDFGDLTEHVGAASGTSDGTYGHVHGGSTEDAGPSSNPGGGAAGTEHSNMVQRLTIQTLGNAQNWGSIGTAKMYTTSTSGSSS